MGTDLVFLRHQGCNVFVDFDLLLAFHVRMTAPVRRLTAATSAQEGRASRLIGTPCGAVAVTLITVVANRSRQCGNAHTGSVFQEEAWAKMANGGRQQACFVK